MKARLILLAAAALCAPALAQTDYSLVPRKFPTFPVPTFKPALPDQPLALDLAPSGAGYSPDNGYTWFDACDKDLVDDDGQVRVRCARMGIKADGVEIGSRAFNGAPEADVYLIVGRKRVARITADSVQFFVPIRAPGFTN